MKTLSENRILVIIIITIIIVIITTITTILAIIFFIVIAVIMRSMSTFIIVKLQNSKMYCDQAKAFVTGLFDMKHSSQKI